MLRAWNFGKRRIHETETQKNYCMRSQTYLEVTKWNECLEEKIGGKFEWKIETQRNRTLKTSSEIPKRKKRNRKLIKHRKN
jgi:hypothetical protein